MLIADDCGALSCIDEAVLELLADRLLTSAAVFPNGPLFGDFGGKTAKTWQIEPHLTLTYGTPLCDLREIESLLRSTGEFSEPRDYFEGNIEQAIDRWVSERLLGVPLEKLELELGAQLAFFESVYGETRRASFHHDIDKKYGEAGLQNSRSSFELGRHARTLKGAIAGAIYRFLPNSADRNVAENHIWQVIYDGIELSRSAGGKVVEVIFHPAANSADLEYFTIYRQARVLEYEALKSNRVRDLLASASQDGAILSFSGDVKN